MQAKKSFFVFVVRRNVTYYETGAAPDKHFVLGSSSLFSSAVWECDMNVCTASNLTSQKLGVSIRNWGLFPLSHPTTTHITNLIRSTLL